jgi:hypothetical protein
VGIITHWVKITPSKKKKQKKKTLKYKNKEEHLLSRKKEARYENAKYFSFVKLASRFLKLFSHAWEELRLKNKGTKEKLW